MTTANVMHLIGQGKTIVLGSLTIDVIIRDVKQSYGKTRYLVAPVAGHGEQWVETIHPARATVNATVQHEYAKLA